MHASAKTMAAVVPRIAERYLAGIRPSRAAALDRAYEKWQNPAETGFRDADQSSARTFSADELTESDGELRYGEVAR